MALPDFVYSVLPFLNDPNTYHLPRVKFRTEGGEWADGPMVRQGEGRREILAWSDKAKAVEAAQDLARQTGGTFEVRAVDRRALQAECRALGAWGSKVVAVVLK